MYTTGKTSNLIEMTLGSQSKCLIKKKRSHLHYRGNADLATANKYLFNRYMSTHDQKKRNTSKDDKKKIETTMSQMYAPV